MNKNDRFCWLLTVLSNTFSLLRLQQFHQNQRNSSSISLLPIISIDYYFCYSKAHPRRKPKNQDQNMIQSDLLFSHLASWFYPLPYPPCGSKQLLHPRWHSKYPELLSLSPWWPQKIILLTISEQTETEMQVANNLYKCLDEESVESSGSRELSKKLQTCSRWRCATVLSYWWLSSSWTMLGSGPAVYGL